MNETIHRRELRAFFEPYAKQAHKAFERVHIKHTGGLHGAGYVCEVNAIGVAKYSDGTNSTTWFPFSAINAITITDRNGCALRSFTVTN